MTAPIDTGISGVHFVTDDRLPFDQTRATAVAAARGGVAIVQLREKNLAGAEYVARVVQLSADLPPTIRLIVNDRVDVAVAARRRGASVAGVHLGQTDIDPLTARQLLGPDAIVGLTANEPAHLAAAQQLPEGTLSYLGVGVINATLTKPDHPAVLGVDGFGALVALTTIPCIAIGGVGLDEAEPLAHAGAAGIAVVTALSRAAHPERMAAQLVSAFTGAGANV